jgi:hypothetical protein
MSVQLQQTKEKIRSWWQRRGNKSLPEGYFLSPTLFMIVFLILVFYVPYTYQFILTVVRYIMQGEIGGQTVSSMLAFSFLTILVLFMVAIYAVLFFALFYANKRTRFTFRNERKTRKIILRRDRWSLLTRYVLVLSVLFSYFYGLAPVVLHVINRNPLPPPLQHLLQETLTSVVSTFPDYFPAFCTFSIFFLCTYLLLNLGLDASERLPYIADSLANLEEPKTDEEYKQWKRDIVYFADSLVGTFAKLGPFDHRVIAEVDLSYLKPILMALFLGNTQEKNEAKKMLSELQEHVEGDERKREANLVDWLLKRKESAPKAFPRLKKVEDILTMRLSVRKGILAATPESVKYIDKIIAIAIGLATLATVIFGLIQVFLTWISSV